MQVFSAVLRGVLTIALSALALPGDTPRSEHTDWTGYYIMARSKDLAGLKPLVNLDQLIIPHLQPRARLKMEATDGMADGTTKS
jgi:hypothetical protein